MAKGSGSLPQGVAVCQPCRRIKRGPLTRSQGQVSEERFCLTCGVAYEATRKNQRYCNAECRPRRSGFKAPAAERGYGYAHAQERKRVKVLVDAGQVNCCLCGRWIQPGTRWHLDHVPGTTDQYRGAAHEYCNTSDGATRGNKNREPRTGLKWERRTCPDCGSDCYGKRCRSCSQRARARAPKATLKAKCWGEQAALNISTCEHCDGPFLTLRSACHYCSVQCSTAASRLRRGLVIVDKTCPCGSPLDSVKRMKCDACIAATRRERKRRERKSESGRRQRREYERRRDQWRRDQRKADIGGPGRSAEAA